MKKRRLAGLTGAFMALMLLFTVLSRAADSAGIANVTVGKPQNMVISHKVEATGRVEQNQEQAVVTEAGLRVAAILVNEGEQVAEGDVLFELDPAFLEECILAKKQELKKQELQMGDADSQKQVSEKMKANDQAQAAENYALSTARAGTALSHARENLEDAKAALEKYRREAGTGIQKGAAEEELEKACEERSWDYIVAEQELDTLKWRIEKAVDDALTQAKQQGTASLAQNARTATQSAGAEEPSLVVEGIQIVGEDADAAGDSAVGAGGLAGAESPMGADPVVILDAGDRAGAEIQPGAPGEAGAAGDSAVGAGSPAETGGLAGAENPAGSVSSGSPGGRAPTQQELDAIEQEIRSSYAPQLQAATQKVEEALAEKKAAEAALDGYHQELLATRKDADAQQEQQLLDAVKSARASYEDAAIAANEAAVTGNRGIQTAGIPNADNSTAEIYELELEQMELELSKLDHLRDQDGQIRSPVDGVVTKINLTTGEKTPDGTAVLLADLAKGTRLTVKIQQEDEKYLSRGDPVTVTSGDGKKTLEEIAVDSVTADPEGGDLRLVTVQIPEGTLGLGEAATLSVTKKSDPYPICVPVSALHVDEKNQTFVLAVQEVDSVLGTERKAFRIPVTVEERNSTYAALTQGALTSSQEVIVSSDKAVSEGSRVRIRA